MKNKILLFLILTILPITIHALQETTLIYEENPTHYKGFHSVVIDGDKNIVTVGYDIDETNNSYKSIISKYKLDGTLIWEKDFLTTDRENRAYGVALANDGYIVVGGSHVKTGDDDTDDDFDIYIYKISKDGEVVWNKEESTTGSDRLDKIVPVSDGYVGVGFVTSEYFISTEEYVDHNAYIRKISNDGTKVWEHTLTGNGTEYYTNLAADGDAIIAGGTTNSTDIEGITNQGNHDGLVVKYNADGTVAWKKSIGTDQYDEIKNVYVLEDGYYLVGTTGTLERGEDHNPNYWFIKISKTGEQLWSEEYTVANDETWNIIPMDNKLYAIGTTYTGTSTVNKYDGYVLEIDSTNTQTVEKLKYDKNVSTLFRDAVAIEDGFIVVGFTRLASGTEVLAAPLMVKYTKDVETPGGGQHNSVDPTEEPTEEPQAQKPQEDNPKTGAFLAAGFVILGIIGLIVFNIRKKRIFNI